MYHALRAHLDEIVAFYNHAVTNQEVDENATNKGLVALMELEWYRALIQVTKEGKTDIIEGEKSSMHGSLASIFDRFMSGMISRGEILSYLEREKSFADAYLKSKGFDAEVVTAEVKRRNEELSDKISDESIKSLARITSLGDSLHF